MTYDRVSRNHRSQPLTIGVVVPRTGRLAKLGHPLAYVMSAVAPLLAGNIGREVRVVERDSRSHADGGRSAAEQLIRTDGARIVLTLAGTQVLPAVADTCEELRTPCVSSTFPWQVYYYGRGADERNPFRWTYHFCWGLDDIAGVFARMCTMVGAKQIGCLWNDGQQGSWTRDPQVGFVPAAAAAGQEVFDPGGYPEPADGFDDIVNAFQDAGVDAVTSAATAEDLALFRNTAQRRGFRPRLITCSRWLTYPSSVDGVGANVATLAYWTPNHPHRSSLDGTTAAELANRYEHDTGEQWLQPLGLAYALFEVAAHALARATDPDDRASVADALATASLDTVAGRLDWTSGPVPNIATMPLAGAQWKPADHGRYDLKLVTANGIPDLPVNDDIQPSTALPLA